MDYAAYKNPPPPKPGAKGGGGGTSSARMRVVSYLWKTTVPGNGFGTDGDSPNVPTTWPGDHLRACRQWHGVNLTAAFKSDGSVDPDSIVLDELSFSGKTETVGMVGKTTVTDRHVTEPLIGSDSNGAYVEVKSLLGTRLGAFIPDIDVNVPPAALGSSSDLTPMIIAKVLSEVIEYTSENQYLGTNTWAPKIFTYARLRLRRSTSTVSWVSQPNAASLNRGSGFVEQKDIIANQFAASWIPEHHIYLNDKLGPSLSLVPTSPNHKMELQKWVDSGKVFDVQAFEAMTVALMDWAARTPLAQKQRVADDFKKRYPDYFIKRLF